MTYSLHEELQSSSYVCCVQSPWAHLLEKQVFQKGMFDSKTNEIGLKTFTKFSAVAQFYFVTYNRTFLP